ncbi:MAG: DUF929 family protein [Candidatus Micrarchaeaceae archaeon]
MAKLSKEHVVYIIVAAAVIIAVASYLLISSSGCSLCGKPVSNSDLQQLQQIANNNTLANQVGIGIVQTTGKDSNIPKNVTGTPLIVNGKVEVLFVGGDFCPYCAVTRWSLVIALMRFGTFSNLTYMESSPTDSDPDTATLSFDNYSYSGTVGFNGFEVYDRSEIPVTPPGYTQFYQSVVNKYSSGGVPFIDFGNASVQSGAEISPAVLRGQDWDKVISNIRNPSSTDAQGIIGAANIFTAYICMSNSTLESSAPACQQSYVKDIIGK